MARFIRKGVSKFYFLPAAAGYLADGSGAPTAAEIAAGTDLTPSVADVAGWNLSNNTVTTPDMSTTFDATIPGTDTAADSSLTFWEDDSTSVIETLLPKGTTGFIYIQRKGAGAAKTKSADLFPVRVAVKSPAYSAGNEGAQFQVQFAITSRPSLDTTPPA